MKVVHKLVVTHDPQEMEERIRHALLQLGCPDPEPDGDELAGTAIIGRDPVAVRVSCEPTAHGHEITIRAVDNDGRAQPARALIRRFGDHYWKLDDQIQPRRSRSSRGSRRRRGRPWWRENLLFLIAAAITAVGLVAYLVSGQ